MREGIVGRDATICKPDHGWTSVFHRVTILMGTEEVIEYTWIDEPEEEYGLRKRPQPNTSINTSFYYYWDSGEESAVPVEVPASPAEHSDYAEYQEGTAGSRHEYVADPEIALNDVKFPHGLPHTLATRDCVGGLIPKRRSVCMFTGVSTTVAKKYGYIRTLDRARIIDCYGPTAIGGRHCMLCIKDRSLHFGYVGPTKSPDGDAVSYHMCYAAGNGTIDMVYTEGVWYRQSS